MSSGIFERDTQFSARLVPWHGKGNILFDRDFVLSSEVNEVAGLDDHFYFMPITYQMGEETKVWTQDRFVMSTKTGEPISRVGAGYEIVQPSEFPLMMDELVKTGDGRYVTAGSLFNRTRMWWNMELPTSVKVSGDPQEEILLYLLGVNSYDMSLQAGFYISGVRVVCNNTMSMAIGTAKRGYTMKHTREIRNRIGDARDAMGLAIHYGDVLSQVADLLANTPFNDSQVEQTLDMIDSTSLKYTTGEKKGEAKTKNALTMATNKRDEFVTVLAKRDDLARIKDTAWGFFQAGVEMNDHHGRFHTTDTSDKWDNRMANIFGMNSTTNFTGDVFQALDAQLGIVKELGLAKK